MKIIEITGIAGVGKSYIIDLLSKRKNTLLDKEIINIHHLNDFRLLYYFFKNNKSLAILSRTIKIAFSLKMSPFHKLNFIRNTIKKFGKNYFITKHLRASEQQTIIIDEGVSHLYQNIITQENYDYTKLLKLIDEIVDFSEISHTIVIVEAENKIVFERLKSRGHKRIVSEEDIRPFIKRSKQHINILKEHFNNTIQVRNDINTNLDNQLNKI